MQNRAEPLLPEQDIEAQLLNELRRAETKFKEAPPNEKPAAEQEFREALRRFSALVLDRKLPSGFSVRP